MTRTIRIHAGSEEGPRSLALFAGRHLGETEFAIMQAYVADRVRPLLAARPPGVLWGLEIGRDARGAAARLTLRPGLAIGGDGRAIRVPAPTALDWPALVEAHKQRTRPPDAPDAPLRGWFYVTVRREVDIVADPREARACDRDRLDPLRDSRVETFAALGLQFVGAGDALMAPSARRAANLIAARARADFAFDRESGAVPVALAKVEDDMLAEEDGAPVLDVAGGRFLSGPAPAREAFLAQWRALAETLPADPLAYDPGAALDAQLDLGRLPPAGPLPSGLVRRIAGRPDGADWLGPELRFDPGALQVEITAARASQIEEMIAREARRGPVDLDASAADRIRVVVAVDDRAWRPDLMDLPETDAALAEATHRRQAEARARWTDWAAAWTGLYGGLGRGATGADGEPTEEARLLFRAIRPTDPPAGALPELPAGEAVREALRLGAPVARPPTGTEAFERLIAERAARAEAEGTLPPRPYAAGPPEPPEDLPEPGDPPDFAANGLYRQLVDLDREIALIEAELDANDRLVSDFDVFIRAQRQQVDSITTSFASIAGGVPGDGGGLQLARWMPFTTIEALQIDDGEEG